MDEREREVLSAWEAEEPGDEFADRVMAAWEREVDARPAAASRDWVRPVVGGVFGFALAAILMLVVLAGGSPPFGGEGSLLAEVRETVDVGGRATAVAEPGAALAWRVDGDGVAALEQDAGEVFYRVEAGPELEIDTPAGTISVLGTCFRAEVMEMPLSRQSVGGAAVGAAVAIVVLVTVYEGRVAVATDEGEATVSAGERTWLRAGAPPTEPTDIGAEAAAAYEGAFAEVPSEDADAEQLREANAALRAAGRAQLDHIGDLESRLAELSGRAASSSDGPDDLDERWFPASEEQLQQLVEECTLRLDQPPINGIEPGDVSRKMDEMGLTDAELPAMRGVVARLHASYVERLRPLYVEATGDADGAASLSPRAMLAEIRDKSTRTPGVAMMQLVRERAGMEEPPTDMSELTPHERALRLFAGLGDELEAMLGEELGEQRAFELRATGGGWPWSRSQFSGCSR